MKIPTQEQKKTQIPTNKKPFITRRVVDKTVNCKISYEPLIVVIVHFIYVLKKKVLKIEYFYTTE